ncbi:MAG: universal stress protein [Xanthobacteraceae bacterium]|nr:universal stress protein [Xanthobacteraceae bacterium]
MIKSILVPATGQVFDDAVMETALRIAQVTAAHIELCYLRAPSWEVTDTPGYSAWAVGGAVAPALAQLDARVEDECGQARVRFAEICRRKGVAVCEQAKVATSITASWREVQGEPDALAYHARHADLVVVGRPGHSNGLTRPQVDAILAQSGRPLLIAGSMTPSSLTGTVFVCWKEAPESARALTAALPLLKAAQRVVIAHVSEELDPTPLSGIAGYLALHGITVETRLLPRRGAVADTLAAAADAHQADLIVLGAYGHSRARERVFGGCTKGFLDDARVPVLMMQ